MCVLAENSRSVENRMIGKLAEPIYWVFLNNPNHNVPKRHLMSVELLQSSPVEEADTGELHALAMFVDA